MLTFTEKLKKRSDIYNFMCVHGKTLRADEDFACSLKIEHIDGSKFDLRSCMWDQCEEKIYVWTEHCGYFYFFKDDLRRMDSKKFEWQEDQEDFKLMEHTVINFHLNE